MKIAIVKEGVVLDIGHYRHLFPYTVFPDSGPTDEWLSEQSCLKVSDHKVYFGADQKLVSCPPYVEDDFVYTVKVEQKTTDEIKVGEEIWAQNLRMQRNFLLAETDWSQGKDIPDTVSAPWAVYRQALRDLPQQEGFPRGVVFPTPPGA